MARLTRKEKQAHTRNCLMKSAAKVFARRGLQQASIDEVAGEAGYTKGAFYANFKNKEELFLAMLDERFGEKLAEIERVAAGDDFNLAVTSDPEFDRLFFEFSAYAARNEDFRQELVTRYKALRGRVGEAIRGRAERDGVELRISPDQIALMTFAMAKGLALENMLEPDAVDDELFSTMLTIFFTGLTEAQVTQARA
ncbi:MAG TPA: TetR/AcrR family transcriptional regulator [Thermoleophilaceae bacterium]|jgi:AcrR family transcriptional regulator|nr:TetR/AcrR family transcriptional regulator [Thermoleophilaceae bacterium]